MTTAEPPGLVRLELAHARPCVRQTGCEPIPLQWADALLLAWLAVEGPTSRERLVGLFWPDRPGAAARNLLRQRLFRLRRHTGVPVVAGTDPLQLHDSLQHDLLGASTLLGSLQGPASAELDGWLSSQRAVRLAGSQRGLETRIEALEAAGDYAQALPLATTLLGANPLSEDAHRRVIRLHYLRGDRASAMLAFDRCEYLLKHEVGTSPSLETLELLATIEQPDVVDRTPSSLGSTPISLLRPPVLVGRAQEIEAFRDAAELDADVQLVGAPGLGRSRLLETLSHGGRLLTISATPQDSARPMAAVRRVALALQARLSQGEPGAGNGHGWPAALDDLAAPARDPFAWLEPMQQLLARAATQAEAVAVNDLQFADGASLDLLEALVHARHAEPHRSLRWCFSMTPPRPGSWLDGFARRLRAGGRCAVVELQPLREQSLAEFLRSLALPGLDPDAEVEPLQRLAGGNPKLTLQAVKLAWRRGSGMRSPVPWPPASLLAPFMVAHVESLPPAALELLRVMAVAGTHFDLTLAERLVGRSRADLTEILGHLEAVDLVRGCSLAYDTVGAAVERGLPPALADELRLQVQRANPAADASAGEPA